MEVKVFKQLTPEKEMRKRVLFWSVLTLVVLSLGFVIASSTDHTEDINKAFNCLDSKVSANTISLDEAIFAALAKTPNAKVNATIAQQKSSSADCWPGSGCSIKTTAQVVLAKLGKNENVSGSINWLKSKTGVTQQMTWYLEISIDSNEPANCLVNYDDSDRSLKIDEEMKLSGNLGSCLSIVPSGYWLKISSNCLDKEFGIQCDKEFKTNLAYEKESGGTLYVSSQTHSAAAGSWTSEGIVAKCFKDGNSCDYEGSLWAATALYAAGEDITQYSPYLRSLASDNERYFPSAFLVAIYEGGDEHYAKIISSERARPEGSYWQMPSSPYSKFYDTALGMMALGGADSPEINNARTLGYLFLNQDESGCWGGGNIRDTAFIIYAAQWQRRINGTGGYCGDGICDNTETSTSCLQDCPLPNYICGDNRANGTEACDGNDLRNETCVSKGFSGGTLRCVAAGAANNCTYDTSSCTGQVQPTCGDGIINGNELCDCGSDGSCTLQELNNKSCSDVGSYVGGSLACSSGCLTYNITGCYVSGGQPGHGNGTNNNQTNQSGGGGTYDPGHLTDCELSSLYCVASRSACQEAGGSFFPQETHACNNFLEYCCTVDVTEVSCTSLQGNVCPWNAPCTTEVVESGDGPCCVSPGVCQENGVGCSSDSDCTDGTVCNLGECVAPTSPQCNDDSDCSSGKECKNGSCVTSSGSGGSNLWIWITVLFVLIILVVLAIIYRDKLRALWYSMKKQKPKAGPSGPPPGMIVSRRPPPRFGPPVGMRPVMGAGPIIRPGVRPSSPAQLPAKNGKEKEDEETLRKLKEMSK